jgi:hypothetical protein
MKTFAFLFITLTAVLIFQACKGPTGDVGPAGPQGVSGVAGATGIITSAWSGTVGPENWFQDANDKTYFSAGFKPPGLTQTIIDRGLIMVYTRLADDPTAVFPLPSVSDVGIASFYPYIEKNEGYLALYTAYKTKTTAPSDILQYRWVFIPPQPGGRLAAVDWKNYGEVKKVLNLAD